MANVTYFTALSAIRNFAVENGYNDTDVIEKVDKLIDQKNPHTGEKRETQAHKDNVKSAEKLVAHMRETGADGVPNKYVADYLGVKSARATAILNAGIEKGWLKKETVEKSPTRRTYAYYLITE